MSGGKRLDAAAKVLLYRPQSRCCRANPRTREAGKGNDRLSTVLNYKLSGPMMRILDWATRAPVMAHERARLSIGLECKNI